MGSGGVLHGSHLGAHIDRYDVVIRLVEQLLKEKATRRFLICTSHPRMNNAPVSGFERDAGSRTTLRLLYPEGAPHSVDEYRETTTVALVVFKSLDLDWLVSVVTRRPLVRASRKARGNNFIHHQCRHQGFWSKLWFWREVVEDIPLNRESFRVLHPEIMRRTGQVLQRYTLRQGNVSRGRSPQLVTTGGGHLNTALDPQVVPTLGASAVVMALQLCDQVSLAGFGYDMQHPQSQLHYYEAVPMEAMKAQVGRAHLLVPRPSSTSPRRLSPQVVHDISAERLFLRELVDAGATSDLTGAL